MRYQFLHVHAFELFEFWRFAGSVKPIQAIKQASATKANLIFQRRFITWDSMSTLHVGLSDLVKGSRLRRANSTAQYR